MHVEGAATRSTVTSGRIRRQIAGLALSAVALAAVGCGNNYRPVVSAINPVGPAAQPTKYAVAISNPGSTTPGQVTLVDFSGDTIMVTPNIAANPQYLALDSGGVTGFTLHADGTLNSFSISTSLQTRNVLQSTLLSGAAPVSIFPEGTYDYVAQSGRNSIAQMTGSPPALRQEISTGAGTVYTVGIASAPRVYALSQGTATGGVYPAGTATAIDTSTNTATNSITVGSQPVYGVMSADARRAFILNKGSNTVSVINAQTNQLDSFPNSLGVAGSTIPVGTAPVWADFAPTRSEMLVLNAGNGTTAGSVSIISVPLCSQTTLVTNPNCDVTNPIDANGFGTVLATVPVGINPSVIAVLQDGTQAFVCNQGNAAAGIQGSVSVINLDSNTVTVTIPASNASTVTATDLLVHGNPNFLAATTGTPTGKVYVTAGNSTDLTIIETDTDTVKTHLPLGGTGVMVRVTAQ
ncbi:DNA-binding beta-propeller fold protein YncE [Granulicella rosea]|uniref:DNA-binding beta-propeller fold protein YncE n=1 Tax=Granulicella rosea TaxID=474952 RepID=A0A239IX63_9BACT|nr:hypothetical protein [Granulicella rosea]SNS97613.1 DNA-binding beta-propeller fold protein YncE [Granulicella rosea]